VFVCVCECARACIKGVGSVKDKDASLSRTRARATRHLFGTTDWDLDLFTVEFKSTSNFPITSVSCIIVELPECGCVEEELQTELAPDARLVSPSDD
jgi:hypothetical protein